jgi:RNA polymerase sigma factor (sigma-70 family)
LAPNISIWAENETIVPERFGDQRNSRHLTEAAARSRSIPKLSVNPQLSVPPLVPRTDVWPKRSEAWRCLMVAAQSGQTRSYEKLLRELDVWLRRYYRRRLPSAAAEDARQDALLAIHIGRSTYLPSKPFGPWLAAIARHKWIDHVREINRSVALSLDDDLMIESSVTTIDSIEVGNLLKHLKPAQAHVIWLVKLQGVSIEDASDATGQSSALVKINIHRGLKRLAALAADDTIPAATSNNSSKRRSFPFNRRHINNSFAHSPRHLHATNEKPVDSEDTRITAAAGANV